MGFWIALWVGEWMSVVPLAVASLATLYLLGQPVAFLGLPSAWRWGSALGLYLAVTLAALAVNPAGGFPPGPDPLSWLAWPGWLVWMIVGPWLIPAT